MKQRDLDALRSIKHECEKIIRDVQTKSFEEFVINELLFEAVLWRITVIGESANRISLETFETLPEQPLRAAIGTRHRIIHGYDSIDSEIIYEIVTVHIRALLKALTE